MREYYEERKLADKKFSQRFIMDKVGATSPSWFNDLVKERINLSGNLLFPLIQLLKLNSKEADYFENLVQYDQSGFLSKKMSPSIRKEEAKQAIDRLLTLGLIKKQLGGFYRPTSEIIIKDSKIRYLHMANFMRAHIELGMEAFDRFPKEIRDLSVMTISISPEVVPKIKEELKVFRRKILDLVDQNKKPSIVSQCNIQLFPTTQ